MTVFIEGLQPPRRIRAAARTASLETCASWLNLVEVWFSTIERQAIHRGTFTSVRELIAAIRKFIASWNDRANPFVWTKTADDILNKANRKTTSNTVH